MSTAEIRAYFYGVGLTRAALVTAGEPTAPLDEYWEVWPAEQAALCWKLGEKEYDYWVQRGARDAMKWQG